MLESTYTSFPILCFFLELTRNGLHSKWHRRDFNDIFYCNEKTDYWKHYDKKTYAKAHN